MRIIVKEKQYNKILFRENKDQQTPNQWATYLFDRLYPYMVNEITEKNVVESNLDKTLHNQNFYKELPINKIIVNTVLGESKKNSYNIDKGDKFIKELEIDFMVTENNTLNKEDILEVFKRVIKEQTDKITFAPGVEEQLDELELYDEILFVDTVFSQLSDNKSHIHVEEVDGYKVVISQENIDDVGVFNWDLIKEYLIKRQKEIEKIEGNIIHYKEDEVKDGENVVSYVDLEDEEDTHKSAGGGDTKIDATNLDSISYSRRSKNDTINNNLIYDIAKASKNAGIKIEITYAKTGHGKWANKKKKIYSRHYTNNAVDISRIENDNGELVGWSSKGNAKKKGVYNKIEKIVGELEKLGYKRLLKGQHEGGKPKTVMSFGFPNHHHHIHISNTNR